MENQLKRGDIVQYHTPFPDEIGSLYIIQEAHYDMERPRVKMAMLDSGLRWTPIKYVFAEDLEVVRDGDEVTELVEKYRATKNLPDA
ncbi:hypothetical protein [Parapedobacter sp.]